MLQTENHLVQAKLIEKNIMMASLKGNIFRVSAPLSANSPHKGQRRGALIFLSAPEQAVEQTDEMPVIWDDITFIM